MPGKMCCKWVDLLGENFGSKFREARVILAFGSLCAVPNTVCVAPLWSCIWGTFWKPNWAQVCLLEIPTCLLSNRSEISKFGAHFPLQTAISQDCFLCVKIGVERSLFGCFWPPEDSKLAQTSWPCTNSHDFPWKIQKCKLFVIWSSLVKARARWRGAQGEKTCFLCKNFQKEKMCSKFLEIWAIPSLSHVMLDQRSLGQDSELILLFLPLLSFCHVPQFLL